MSGIYNIPLSAPFVDVLARGLLQRTKDEALALPRMTILLPTVRACRALREAFLRAGDTPLLLPRLLPIGEADADELAFYGSDDIPPAVSTLRRQALLARALLKSGYAELPAEALALARALARVLDEAQTEEVDLKQLETLVPDMFALHWQKTLSFLGILGGVWPHLLAAENAIDPATRRGLALRAQAALWEKAPPTAPVIVAGVTGSIKAVRALMHTVAALPLSEVILPGLDQTLDEEAWQAIDAVHPQYAMKTFIEEAKLTRKDVALWSLASEQGLPTREKLIGEIFRPAATVEAWHSLNIDTQPDTLRGLHLCECKSKQEEADAIAALFRHTLETPGKRAALVTPDRELARLVVAACGRWNIAVNDSAGMPLAATPPGAFLSLVAAMAASDFAPVDLLACFKHPLARGGLAPGVFRTLTRRLEKTILRGSTPAPGIEGLLAALAAPDIDAEARDELVPWLENLAILAVPLTAHELPADKMLHLYVAFAEALATGPEGCVLWETENGEALAGFVAQALTALAGFPALQRDDFPTFLTALMAGEVVRPRAGLHARLSIWGPIEARLQQADLIVLGGLNEGSWPEAQAPDPFLSRKMREALPLPQPEYRIGLDAHDFAAALGAPEVVLTRARRVEGAPSIPSRWLMRLEAVLKALKLELPLLAQGDPAALMRHLDLPDGPPRPAGQPHPAPPVAARPRQLSITDVEAWLANPYRLYARRILRLKPLDPLAPEPGAAEKGTLIHTILDRFLKAPPASEPLAALIDLGRAVFDEFKIPPALRLIWWPRFARIAAWFVEMQISRAAAGIKNLASEAEGKLAFPAPGGTFQLTGKIDRIDQRPEGLEIIDYKTGTIPAKDEVESGARPQLPLSAAIVEGGGVKSIAGAVAQLAYWQISGGTTRGAEKIMTATPPEILNRLQKRVALFDNPAVPYTARPPKPNARDYHAAYAHLARTAEWANDAEGEE